MQATSTRIQQRMADLDIRVSALAESTTIPRMTLTRRLNEPAALTLSELDRIAAALEVSPLWLLTGGERSERAEAS